VEKISVAFIVETGVGPEQEKRYNEWLKNIHIPLVLKSPGILRARRYKSMDSEGTYLTIFEMGNDEAAKQWDQGPVRKAAHQNKLANWGEGGFTVNWAGYFSQLQIRGK
jgi:antibiotic biosynthesis monooxygenase (ABM) superfamily enzyme